MTRNTVVSKAAWLIRLKSKERVGISPAPLRDSDAGAVGAAYVKNSDVPSMVRGEI